MKKILVLLVIVLMTLNIKAQMDTISHNYANLVVNGDTDVTLADENGNSFKDVTMCIWGVEGMDSLNFISLVIDSVEYMYYTVVDVNDTVLEYVFELDDYDPVHFYQHDLTMLTSLSNFRNISLRGTLQPNHEITIRRVFISYVIDNVGIDEYTNEIKVYPNPVKDILTVEGTYEKLMLFNSNGQLLYYDDNCGGSYTRLDASNLKSGMYVLVFDNRKEVKFIKR